MPKRKRSKKWISWLIIFALLIAAGIVCYLVWDNYFNDKKDSDEGEEPESSIQEDSEERESKNEDEGEEDDKKVKQYEGEDPNKAEELSGVVTYAGAVGDTVMIRMNIDQYLGGGSCKLSLLKDNTLIYEDTADVVSSASTSTCEGFDVPVSELSNGNYDIVIKIETSDKTGTITGEFAL